MEESDILKKLESIELKRQMEILSSFLPDHVIQSAEIDENAKACSAILLYIEASGLTSLCEKYNKIGDGGICKLSATLNAHSGVLIEIIQFHGGDLYKFGGDEYLACWKVESTIQEALHNVIVCALYIHDNFGCFSTEVNIPLKLKLIISYGEIQFHVFGEAKKFFVILGSPINHVKYAKSFSSSGDVLVSTEAWKHLQSENYDYELTVGGFIKVWNCFYKTEGQLKDLKDEYEEKQSILDKLCSKHLDHRAVLHKKKNFGDTLTDIDIMEKFVRSVPARPSIKLASKHGRLYYIKPFVLKLIQNQLDKRQAVEDLTEMRELTVQYISIAPIASTDEKLVDMLEKICGIIEDAVSRCLGVVTNISWLEKDILVIVAFGLRRFKYELESKNALLSAYKIHQMISKVDNVKSVSIGISNGIVYTGIIGHPFRREFVVIGKVVNRAGRLMCSFPNKVICDHTTYRNSKLSSHYFQLQTSSSTKGFQFGNIFEFNENFKQSSAAKADLIIVGRDEESELTWTIINHPDKVNYYGVCFHGQEQIGKSKLIQSILLKCQKEEYTFASIDLCRNTQRPYFCVSTLYKQLYNLKSRVNSDEFIFVQDLPTDLWDFNDILQGGTQTKNNVHVQRKFKILNLFREITRNSKLGFAVLFIDNIQYIDVHSFDILEIIVQEKCIRLVSAGHFEKDFWDIRWKISLNNYIKLFELSPLMFQDILLFASSVLKVDGIPTRIITMLKNLCNGVPGIMENFLWKLMNEGHLTMEFASKSFDYNKYVFLNNTELERCGFTNLSDRKLICKIPDEFECPEKVTISTLSEYALDSYDPFKLSLVKISSCLGQTFNRSMLNMLFKYPSEFAFCNAIKYLFHRDIFECGTKFLSPIGLVPKNLYCSCKFDHNERKQNKAVPKLPKYAFCKVLHFKNEVIREIAYNMLSNDEKRELNLKVTSILEDQSNSCCNCMKSNSAPIVLIPKFREIFLMCCATGEIHRDDVTCSVHESENIETVLSKSMKKKDVIIKRDAMGCKRKIWDSSICHCLEILIKVYQDLVYHSKEAGHVEKVIYFLIQNGFIMMLINEFQDAILIFEEASELCKINKRFSEVTLSETFKNVHEAKINLLRAEAYLNLGNPRETRKYLLESLKQYEITIMPYNGCSKLLGVQIFKSTSNKIKHKNSMFKSDFGTCLNLVSNLFASEGDWHMAKIASTQCINFINNEFVNMNVLCDIYSNAITIYNICGEEETCKRLEKYVSQHILKKFTSNATLELFSISKLIYTIFQTRFFSAKIETAIRLGYRAIDLNNNIQAYHILTDVVITLAGALLMVKRIEDSVEVAKILYNIGKVKQDHGLLAYYVYNFELMLETSFILEPLDKILKFCEDYYKIFNGHELSTLENALLIYSYVYHLRNSRWADMFKWKSNINVETFQCTSVQSVKNLFKYTEAIMISFVRNEMVIKKHTFDAELKNLKKYLKKCKAVAGKWKNFKPRYLHYKAYYCRILERKADVKRYLKLADVIADEQGNILEKCWLMQSRNFWKGGLSFEGDKKCIDWKMVKAYSPIHWSQILYGLPWHP